MRSLVCNSHMSASINGSPIEEFVPQRGLKQGGPLAPFLFLIVAKGLVGLYRKAVEDVSMLQ